MWRVDTPSLTDEQTLGMRHTCLESVICVVAASCIFITTPIFQPFWPGRYHPNVAGVAHLSQHRAQYIMALLDNITGSADYESNDFSFPYPTEKCNRVPQPKDCCGNVDHSLMKNVTTLRKVPKKLLIGIGTLKSGTHFFNVLLQQHPKVKHGLHKEFQYFYGRKKYKNGKEGYLEMLGVDENTSQDDLDNKIHYEITPGTLKIPWAPCYLKSWFPDAKFLVIMRNPAMRALSQLRYKQSRCLERARNREIDSIAACCGYLKRSSIEFLGRLMWQLKRIGCTFNEGKEQKSWKACLDELWGEDAKVVGSAGLLVQGLYGPQIAWWMEFFPPSQFIFVKAEDLYQDPVGEMNKILEAFEVSPKFGEGGVLLDDSEEQQHKTNWTNILDPQLDIFMDSLERFYHRPNKELSMLLEKKGVHREQFNSSEISYKNGEILEKDFLASMEVQCPEEYS